MVSECWLTLINQDGNKCRICIEIWIESNQFDLECPINAVEVKWMHYAEVQQRSNDAYTCRWSNHSLEMDCNIIKIPLTTASTQAEWNWFRAYGCYLILTGAHPLQMSLWTKLFWARHWKQNQLITEEPRGPEGDIGSSVKAG